MNALSLILLGIAAVSLGGLTWAFLTCRVLVRQHKDEAARALALETSADASRLREQVASLRAEQAASREEVENLRTWCASRG